MISTDTLLTTAIVIGWMLVLAAGCKRGDHKTTIRIEAEFRQMPVSKTYKNVKVVSTNKNFQSHYSEYAKARESYDSMDVGASVEGSYGPFSASVSASYSSVTQSASSMSQASGSTNSRETHTEEENTEEREYFEGQFQIMRDITTTVTINGVSASVEEKQIVTARAIDNPMSWSERKQLGRDYIAKKYGEEANGLISGNIFSQSQCYPGPKPKVWKKVESKEVPYPHDLESVPLSIKTNSYLGSNEVLDVQFHGEGPGMAGGFRVTFSNPAQYNVWGCTGGTLNLPRERDMEWTIYKIAATSKTTAPKVVVTCNDVEVLNLEISESTCTTSRRHAKDVWYTDVVKFYFAKYTDTASNFYIPDTSCVCM